MSSQAYNDWGRSTRARSPLDPEPGGRPDNVGGVDDLSYERAARARRWRGASSLEHPVAGQAEGTAIHPEDAAADAQRAEAADREVHEFNRRGLWVLGLPQYQ